MHKDFKSYAKESTSHFFEAIINLLVFFPYFFSFTKLLKTLFSPWKNLVTKKTTRGFSFSEWTNRAFLNMISSSIGFCMRLSIIIFFIIFETIYVVSLPLIILLFFICFPFFYIKYLFQKTEEVKKIELKKWFISTHLIKEENRMQVEEWFESFYQIYFNKTKWWKLSRLLTYPPLARDWAVGFTPTLDEYTEELTTPTYQSRFKSIIGRINELKQIEEVLSKHEEANILIVGDEGVGKHTVVDALAKKIYEGQINQLLAYKRILKINFEKILTVFTDQKQREAFLEALLYEAVEAKNIILLIENIDKYVAYGADRVDLSIPIEKFGKTSSIQFIGITSPFFYERFIFSNEKINRIFTKIEVNEISKKEALLTLLNAVPQFEYRYSLSIPFETIENCIEKSEFYITHIPFPEKALDLLDSACVFYKTNKKNQNNSSTLLPDHIEITLSEKTHIPTQLTDNMRTKLIDLEQLLGQQVIFQEHAITMLSGAMRRSFILLGKRKKPLSTFLFLGPTGVGKTETAKALARIFFGGEKHLLRFDMSLYQTISDIPKLIGSIESGIPGLLSKVVRETPYAVLLLDEIEKADKNLLNIFLTILDEGYFTDGFGKRVDCKNLIIIATSNAGADFIFQSGATLTQDLLIQHLISKSLFSPEFLNRFDGVVLYNPITDTSIISLALKMIESIKNTIYSLYKINITVSEATLTDIIKRGYNPAFGARNLDRIIATELEDRIAKLILEKKVSEGETIQL